MSGKQDWDKYGVTVPPDLTEQIERPLEYGDSRAKRIRELIRLGLAVEDAMVAGEMFHPLIEEREKRARVAMEEYIERRH